MSKKEDDTKGRGPGLPVIYPRFARYMQGLIEPYGWTYREIADELKNRAGHKVQFATVHRDLTGRIGEIPPDRLRAYAEIFNVKYEDLLRRWVEDKYGVHPDDLTATSAASVYPPETAGLHSQLETIFQEGDADWVEALSKTIKVAYGSLMEKKVGRFTQDDRPRGRRGRGPKLVE